MRVRPSPRFLRGLSLFHLALFFFFSPLLLFLLFLFDRPRRELDCGHPCVEGRKRVAVREVRLALERERRDGFCFWCWS